MLTESRGGRVQLEVKRDLSLFDLVRVLSETRGWWPLTTCAGLNSLRAFDVLLDVQRPL